MDEEKIILNFIVKDRIIKFDKSSLTEKVVGDNTGYVANFIFDEEWTNKVKTARFIKDGTYVDMILDDNDQCDIPLEVLKSGTLEVGVFAGNLRSSTSCKVSIKPSILESNRLPAAPTDDVYAQIIEKVEAIESVKKAVINDDGILVITLTSGLELNVGQARGVGIKSFEQTKSSTEDSGENEFLVTLTDDTEFSFKIQNGSKGSKGDKGETGATPKLTIGTVETLSPNEESKATISGTSEEPVLNLSLVKGDTGATPDISIGTVETVKPNESAEATMTGTAENPVLSLKVPQGKTGLTPNLSVGTVTTVAPTESASATMTGTKEEPVLNLSIPRGSVADGDVDPDKTTWMRRVFYNIFDKNTILDGYGLNLSGNITGDGTIDSFVSDYISVFPLTTYRMSTACYVRFFDYDKNYVGNINNLNNTIITIPSNVHFIRITNAKSKVDINNFQVHEYFKGNSFPYSEYKTDYIIVPSDEEYSEMIRDISSKNTWDLIEEANRFVDYNTGVLSDEQVKAGYLSILQTAGYTNVRSQLDWEYISGTGSNKWFSPKSDAVIPKKIVFVFSSEDYPPNYTNKQNNEKYEGVTDLIFDYSAKKATFLGIGVSGISDSNGCGLKEISKSVCSIVFPKNIGKISAWTYMNLPNLEKIVFYNVDEIWGRAFYNLPKLKKLHLPVGVGDWGSNIAFSLVTLDELTVEKGFHSTIYVSSVMKVTNPNAASICHAIIENLADLSGYTLTTQAPSDWSTNYVNYYIKTFEYALTTEEPSDWSTNYIDYYTKTDDVYTQITDETAPTWVENTYYAKNDVYVQITDETAPTWVEDTYYASNSKPIYFGTNLLALIDDEHKQMLTDKNWRYS